MSRLKQLLKYSNITLVLSLLLFIVTIHISYFSAEHYELEVQITAHIATIVIAAVVKLAYVSRCVCLYQLGMEVR
ncbi:hypothetical protein [Pseudoalteromonas 'SMAR']|uniref:hypothetical protein n=1 Tax=Pseudoalteromonas 'SMAR' TaxID=3416908 RepID=UPI003AF221F2